MKNRRLKTHPLVVFNLFKRSNGLDHSFDSNDLNKKEVKLNDQQSCENPERLGLESSTGSPFFCKPLEICDELRAEI